MQKFMNVRLPIDVYRSVKIAAVQRDMQLGKFITIILEEALKKEAKKG